MIISLTGFMGCGKSSVGKRLATIAGGTFIDLDSYIETREGKDIPLIFKEKGEQYFRRKEKESLEEIFAEKHGSLVILSLGGGTLTSEGCADLVRENSFCIYLKAGIDTLVRNLENDSEGRPMLSGCNDRESLKRRIEKLMSEREGIYSESAAATLLTDNKDFTAVAEEIRSLYMKSSSLS